MASLDLTEVIDSPEFQDIFLIIRRAETISLTGRSTITPTYIQSVRGVVTPITPNNLDRAADYQTFKRSIKITTTTPLQGEITGYQPDIVVWRGDNFIVSAVSYFTQFGQGYYQVECLSIDRTDVLPDVNVPIVISGTSSSTLIAAVL